jgi:hypothetical protein
VILDKIRSLTTAPYPAFGATVEAMLGLDDASLDRPWEAVVTALTTPAA